MQPLLEYAKHNPRLQIHDKIRTTRKHPIRSLSRARVRLLCHIERLLLKHMPGSSARHRVVREIAYGIDGLAADGLGGFVQEGVEEDALEGGECGRR